MRKMLFIAFTVVCVGTELKAQIVGTDPQSRYLGSGQAAGHFRSNTPTWLTSAMGNTSLQILNRIPSCHMFNGPSVNARWSDCIAAVPAAGGTADATGISGDGTLSADPFDGVTKPLRFVIGAGTLTQSVNITVPSNVDLVFSPGSIISVNSGITLTINGTMVGDRTQRFAGAGTVVVTNRIPEIYPEWWGAVADTVTNNQEAFQSMSRSVNASGGGTIVLASNGIYHLGDALPILPGDKNGLINVSVSGVTLKSTGSVLTYNSVDSDHGPAIWVSHRNGASLLNGFTMDGITIQDLSDTPIGFAAGGVETYHVGNVRIRNSTFIDVKGNASITVGGEDGVEYAWIENNKILGTSANGYGALNGINFVSVDHGFVRGNTIVGHKNGILGGGDTNNLTIDGNYIELIPDTVGGSGISTFGGNIILITGNKIRGTAASPGLDASAIIPITEGGAGVISKLVIRGNVIDTPNYARAIFIQNDVAGLDISDNIAEAIAPISSDGGDVNGIWSIKNNSFTASTRIMLVAAGNLSIAPTALLNISNNTFLSSDTSNPLKVIDFTVWTNAKSYQVQLSSNIMMLTSSVRHAIQNGQIDGFTASSVTPNVRAGAISADVVDTVLGALVGDDVSMVDKDLVLPRGVTASGKVTAADKVTWFLTNGSGSDYTGGFPDRLNIFVHRAQR